MERSAQGHGQGRERGSDVGVNMGNLALPRSRVRQGQGASRRVASSSSEGGLHLGGPAGAIAGGVGPAAWMSQGARVRQYSNKAPGALHINTNSMNDSGLLRDDEPASPELVSPKLGNRDRLASSLSGTDMGLNDTGNSRHSLGLLDDNSLGLGHRPNARTTDGLGLGEGAGLPMPLHRMQLELNTSSSSANPFASPTTLSPLGDSTLNMWDM